jgi:hypothetical protein
LKINLARPFTVHLNGITRILLEQGYFNQHSEESQEFAALVGVLDQPTHILGRQSEQLHFWQKYCQNHQIGIEELTALPFELLHILAAPFDSLAEERLLQWTPKAVDPMTQKLWDASRLGGFIMVRELRRNHGLEINFESSMDACAVKQVMSLLRDIRPEMNHGVLFHWDGMLYPLVAAGSQYTYLGFEEKAFIKECVVALLRTYSTRHLYYQAILTALETFWEGDGVKSLEQVATDLGLELWLS